MRIKVKKAIIMTGIACMLAQTVTGCSSAPTEADETSESETKTDETDAGSEVQPENETGENKTVDQNENFGTAGIDAVQNGAESNEAGQSGAQPDNASGRWHVLAPEVAAVVDADFQGMVWKVDTDSFYIVESSLEILEDGSIVGSSPSSSAKIPDSELIQVVFDADTYFYIRTIYDGGTRHEDAAAGFDDLEENVSVEMKGEFINDIFHADEIRIIKVS